MRGDDRRILAADIFHFEDVLVNSIYAFGLQALVRLLGDAPEAAEFRREADKTLQALLSKCWDEEAGAFFDLSGVAETPVKVVTISSLMPLILEDLPRPIVARLVDRWVTSTDDFWLPYPLPSVPASNPKFMPGNPRGFIWREPVKIGDVLCVYTELIGVGNTSIDIHVEAWTQRARIGNEKKVTEAKFKFVALDDNGRPTPVPK